MQEERIRFMAECRTVTERLFIGGRSRPRMGTDKGQGLLQDSAEMVLEMI